MARKRIVKYSLGWMPGSNRAVAAVDLEDGDRKALPIDSAAELAAVAAVLREAPVYLYDTGLIASGDEPPG